MSLERSIRFARPGDGGQIAEFVRDLARYEKLEEFAVAEPGHFEQALFGPTPTAEVLLAEVGGDAVGFALFYPAFSTFQGEPRLYLEDLFVAPEARGQGHGRALLAALAAIALERGWTQMAWSVLDWNAPSISFYEGLGAEVDRTWLATRLSGEALRKLGDSAQSLA